jgi:hypothetical protein
MMDGAAARHCRPDAMKHVFPKFLRPHTPGHAAESRTKIMPHAKRSYHQQCVHTQVTMRTSIHDQLRQGSICLMFVSLQFLRKTNARLITGSYNETKRWQQNIGNIVNIRKSSR